MTPDIFKLCFATPHVVLQPPVEPVPESRSSTIPQEGVELDPSVENIQDLSTEQLEAHVARQEEKAHRENLLVRLKAAQQRVKASEDSSKFDTLITDRLTTHARTEGPPSLTSACWERIQQDYFARPRSTSR